MRDSSSCFVDEGSGVSYEGSGVSLVRSKRSNFPLIHDAVVASPQQEHQGTCRYPDRKENQYMYDRLNQPRSQ